MYADDLQTMDGLKEGLLFIITIAATLNNICEKIFLPQPPAPPQVKIAPTHDATAVKMKLPKEEEVGIG